MNHLIVFLLAPALASIGLPTTVVAAISPRATLLPSTPKQRRPYLSHESPFRNHANPHENSGNYDVAARIRSPLLDVRGGSIESDGAPLSLLTPSQALTYTGASLLAAFTIALVKKVPRSGGKSPALVSQFLSAFGVGESASTALFHTAYVLHCLVVIGIAPPALKRAVFGPVGVVLLGTVFPLVESIKAAARSNDDSAATSHSWLMYWIMHGIFSFATHDAGRLMERFGPRGGEHWYEFQFYVVLWLILPFTDGAAVVYERVSRPYVVPVVKPLVEAAEGWLTTLVLGMVNVGHVWFVSFFFMALPTAVKRFAVIACGTAYPVAATIVATATTDNDNGDSNLVTHDKWLTYWSCFALLSLTMTLLERSTANRTPPGLYTFCLAVTLYLMLPIFEGSDAIFRNVLVPLFRQRESLLIKDARRLAREMVRQLPVGRHGVAGEAAAKAFLEEAHYLTKRRKGGADGMER